MCNVGLRLILCLLIVFWLFSVCFVLLFVVLLLLLIDRTRQMNLKALPFHFDIHAVLLTNEIATILEQKPLKIGA